MKKEIRIILWTACILMGLCVAVILLCYIQRTNDTEVEVLTETENAPQDILYSFMGKPIVINDSICEQIAAIAVQDSMLSCCDSIIRIGDVRWRINLHSHSITLITSVDFDAPQMKKVVEYLNTKYGMPYEDEDFDMKWSSSPDPNEPFMGHCTLIHLRPLHSEVGGTVLIVN